MKVFDAFGSDSAAGGALLVDDHVFKPDRMSARAAGRIDLLGGAGPVIDYLSVVMPQATVFQFRGDAGEDVEFPCVHRRDSSINPIFLAQSRPIR